MARADPGTRWVRGESVGEISEMCDIGEVTDSYIPHR